jgi:hypothetical protein
MRRLPVLALLPLLACGGSGTGPAPADLETISQSGSLANSAQVATDVTVAFKVLHGPSGAVTTPENGKSVTFTVLTGGGTVAGAATTTVNTGADGVASATWHLGPAAGVETLRGSINGTQSVDVGITAIVPALPKLLLATAPSGTVQSGIPFFQQPVVQLADPNGNPTAQAGVPVTVSVASGSATLGSPALAPPVGGPANLLTVNSDATGKATFSDLALTGSGSNTLQFSATGYNPVATAPMSVGTFVLFTLGNGIEGGPFGSMAGSQTYGDFTVPAGTTDFRVGLYNGTGTVHLYARKGQYPTATAFDCASMLTGTSQLCTISQNAEGHWYLAANGITTYQSVLVRAVAYGPSCARQPLAIGVATPGTLSNGTDCLVPTNKGARDRYSLNPSTQQTLVFNLTTNNPVNLEVKSALSSRDVIGFPAGSAMSLPFLIAPGDHDVEVADAAPGFPAGQSYTLTATPSSANLASCGPVTMFETGVVAALNLAATDCSGITAGTKSDRFYTWALTGQTITVTMSSSAFDPYLRVLADQALGAGTVLAFDDNGGGGTTARVTFTNPDVPRSFTIEATSAAGGGTGAYTLTFDLAPAIYNTPAALLAALHPLQQRPPPR